MHGYGWIQAIDEALVTSHLGVADKSDSYDTAKRKLNDLIDWHIAVATDPMVNGGKVLVPKEPTDRMLTAMVAGRAYMGNMKGAWRGALSSARLEEDA